MHNIKYYMRAQYLTDKAINSTKRGVSDEDFGNELIVSLTTYGKRLYSVHLAIESIMQGSVLPNRIILWLGDDLKDTQLPAVLRNQMKRGLEIAYCKDVKSYKKLYPTLCNYPEADVITIDDDIIYNYDLVEALAEAHRTYHDCIVARRIHKVVIGDNGKPVAYNNWEWGGGDWVPSLLNFFTGCGGVYYPAGSFDKEVMREEVFTDICKYADDVWFYAMAVKKGTKVMRVRAESSTGEDYLLNDSVQDMGLCKTNVDNGFNDKQIAAVFARYNINEILVRESERLANR
ncbi:MAG: hypothetical protein PUD39_06380 [Bacteroidales bacterium]|nr:hypothetical protein [Bacteroidales bacterium]